MYSTLPDQLGAEHVFQAAANRPTGVDVAFGKTAPIPTAEAESLLSTQA
jgi:hypothetical protein